MQRYSTSWYSNKRNKKQSSSSVIASLVTKLAHPRSVIDIGCGDGTWLSAFLKNGVKKVKGYDGPWISSDILQISPQYFEATDLNQELKLNESYDLAISLEVGEHLNPSSSKTLVKNLTSASGLVLFSAAIPGQGGTNHINEQWQSYWAEIFLSRGYYPIDILRQEIWGLKNVYFFYKQNIILYASQEKLNQLPALQPFKVENIKSLDIVHPSLYLNKVKYSQKYWDIHNLIPEATSIKTLSKYLLFSLRKKLFNS